MTTCLGMLVTVFASQSMKHPINQGAYAPILQVVAKGESNGNYNAYFGHGNNTELRLTDMTLGEILAWQDAYVRQGNASNAVGKYQIISPTLRGLVRELKLPLSTRFDAATQDHMAIALINRRGAEKFIQKKISSEEFAANLAKEWASLPKVTGSNAEQSYYAGDGLNKAQVSRQEILAAVTSFEQQA